MRDQPSDTTMKIPLTTTTEQSQHSFEKRKSLTLHTKNLLKPFLTIFLLLIAIQAQYCFARATTLTQPSLFTHEQLVGVFHHKNLLTSINSPHEIWPDTQYAAPLTTAHSGQPQLLLSIEPASPRGALVHVYGTDKDTGKNRTRVYICDANGQVAIEGYKEGSKLCFVVLQPVHEDSWVYWLHKCHILGSNLESLDVDLTQDTRPVKLELASRSKRDSASTFALAGVPATVNLNSPLDLDDDDDDDHHYSTVTIHTDHQGNIVLATNTKLAGTISIHLDGLLPLTTDIKLDGDQAIVSTVLDTDCQDEQVPLYTGLTSWAESIGLGTRPPTEMEARRQGWTRINTKCNDDINPGWRYEDPLTPENYGLVLLYDASGVLTGAQIAVPRALAASSIDYNYAQSPYYILGQYDGEPAYLITLYMDDREDVCQHKTIRDLLCDTAIGHHAFIVTETSQVPLFRRQKDATANGWYVQKSFSGEGDYLAPHDYNVDTNVNDLPPYLAVYQDGSLVGMTFLHYVANSLAPQFTNTIFERGNPGELFLNAPNNLVDLYDDGAALRTNLYIGDDDPRDFVSSDSSTFFIQVIWDGFNNGPVEGALVRFETDNDHHTMIAAQLATDKHGKAFAAFSGDVHEATVHLETKTRRISEGKVWKATNSPYRIHRSHHRQTIKVDTIKQAVAFVTVDFDQTPQSFQIWTDNDDDDVQEKALIEKQHVEPFKVSLDVKEIHLFGYNSHLSIVTYHVITVDPNRHVTGHNLKGLDIHATLHKQKTSVLNVKESQTDSILVGSMAKMSVGVAHLRAREVSLPIVTSRAVHLNTDSGLLVGWKIYGPEQQKHQPMPDIDHAITPFNAESSLLKTVNIKVHICLANPRDLPDEEGSDKEAIVDVSLEYEWATQDDSREIIPVDYKGDVYMKNIPCPAPGESLNVTLISRIEPQMFYDTHDDYHQPEAVHYQTITYDDDGPIHIHFCHNRETIVVVVSNGVTKWRMDGVHVKVRPDGDQDLEKVTNEEGAAFFSFGHQDDDDGRKYHVDVDMEGYDHVHLTRFVHMEHATQVVYVDLYPKKTIRVHVTLETEHEHTIPAIGATIDWAAEYDGGILGVDGSGKADIVLSGKSEHLMELTAFLPWQATCGSNYHDWLDPQRHGKLHYDRHHYHRGWGEKLVYGVAKIHGEHFALSDRSSPKVAERHLTLPRIERIHFKLALEGTFPDVARLQTDLMGQDTVHVEEGVLHDHAHFYVRTGARIAHLFTAEYYTAMVTLTPVNPCLTIDSDTLDYDTNQVLVQHGIHHRTVHVTVKTVDHNYRPFYNVSMEYILGETTFGKNTIQVDADDAEIHYHLPDGLLVHIHPIVPRHVKADPHNPTHFVARDGLEIILVFDGTRYQTAIVTLVGEGFNVPEDTLVRYVSRDWDGDITTKGVGFTDVESSLEIDITLDTAYIEFAVGGSDGFDPVFFQPFDYVYNISKHHSPYWTAPLHIEVPAKTLKNVIVAVRDCFTGEILDIDALVKFPEDSPAPRSWYDRTTMLSRSAGYTDNQGMTFFHLEPDFYIPVWVSAHGYKDFYEKINLASNVTYLVEANLCKYITVTLKLVDAKNHNQPVHHATVSISIDDNEPFELTTNKDGKAKFGGTTAMKLLTLQVVDASEYVIKPVFELHDDCDYLKEGDVDIRILERLYSIELATASCLEFHHFTNVPVSVQIDSHAEFVLKSDSHGLVQMRITESSQNITAKVLQVPEDQHVAMTADKHFSLAIMPGDDLPKRFHFNFISFPVLISLRLVDNYNKKSAVHHATVRIRVNDFHDDFEVTTDKAGKAQFHVPTSTTRITLQLVDASENVIDPVFELHDDCSDFLAVTNVDIRVLERMYTMYIATASCLDFKHYPDVPVLVSVGYLDGAPGSHHHRNIHDDEENDRRLMVLQSPHGHDHEKHLAEFYLVSDQEGYAKLRIHESAANVTMTIIEPPKGHKDVQNLGLMPKEDLPEKFDFVFFALPKLLVVSVRNSHTGQRVHGADVTFRYFDPPSDIHKSKYATTDKTGRAATFVDGCVQYATFVVDPPARSVCEGPAFQVEKRPHWNVLTEQKFKIGLVESSKDQNVHLSVEAGVKYADEVKYTTETDLHPRHPSNNNQPDPFFHRWHLTVSRTEERVTMLTVADREHIMGLTVIPLCCVNDEWDVPAFQGSVEVIVTVENDEASDTVQVEWQVGFGLGTSRVSTDSNGRIKILAPRGHLLALKPHGHNCHPPETVIEEAKDKHKITLKCG